MIVFACVALATRGQWGGLCLFLAGESFVTLGKGEIQNHEDHEMAGYEHRCDLVSIYHLSRSQHSTKLIVFTSDARNRTSTSPIPTTTVPIIPPDVDVDQSNGSIPCLFSSFHHLKSLTSCHSLVQARRCVGMRLHVSIHLNLIDNREHPDRIKILAQCNAL